MEKYSSHGTNVSLSHWWSKYFSGSGDTHSSLLGTKGAFSKRDADHTMMRKTNWNGSSVSQHWVQIPHPTNLWVFKTINLREGGRNNGNRRQRKRKYQPYLAFHGLAHSRIPSEALAVLICPRTSSHNLARSPMPCHALIHPHMPSQILACPPTPSHVVDHPLTESYDLTCSHTLSHTLAHSHTNLHAFAGPEEEQKASWWKWKWRVKKLASFRKRRSWHLVPSLHGK